jgi:putative DNA primase/helicase
MAESKDYRQILTDKLIEQLESGTAPWQKPWDAKAGIPRRPYNPISGKEYRGANSLYLSMYGRSDPRWATYKQAAAEGWQVRKGEKGALVEYWKFQDEQPAVDDKGQPIMDPETGKQKTITVQLERPQVFRAVVFNAEQMDNVPELAKGPRQYEWDPLDRAEQILVSSGAAIFHDQNDRAFYQPGRDEIHMPGRDQFPSPQAYYSTALHELGHWTGHESRLNRDLTGGFGSTDYAKEELRAELASYFLADKLGIPHEAGGLDQHAAYVKSWIKALKDDKNEIFRASKAAEEITEYVLQLDRDRTKEVGLEQGDRAQELAVENTAIVEALRDVAGGEGRTADLAEARERLNAATAKAFDAQLPADWNGDVQVVALVEIKDGDRVNVEPARLHPDRQPDHFGVYAKSEEGPAEWVADRASLADANKLAYRLASIYETALPDPRRKPEVTHSLPEQELAKERVDLVVPFKDKEAVKALGAKWDTKGKTWYAPEGTDLKPLAKWMQAKEQVQVVEVPAAPKAAHEIKVADFAKDARAEKLVLHGRDWQVFHGEKDMGFAEGETAQAAIARVHEREVNNALWGNSKDAPWASDPEHTAMGKKPSMPPPEVLAEYPHLVEKFAEVVKAAPGREPEPAVPARETPAPGGDKTYLAVPFKEKDQARAAGAKWDKDQKAWYAPPGVDMSALSKWVPKQDLGQAPVDPTAAFLKELREVGLVVEEPIMDGKLQRVPVEGKGKGNRDGAYVGYLDGRPSGFIQNFSTGETRKWKLDGPELSPEDKARLAAEAASKLQQRAKDLEQQHDEAARTATARWDRAPEMQPGEHTPYTTRKQVEAYGVRREGQNMLVPVRDIDGKLWAVQTVFPEKKALEKDADPIDKVFTKGGKKEGNFHLIGEVRPGEPIITAEGYATGATLHAATGYTVAVAFDSGNLSAVVGALKERYPTNPQFIGADDDRFPKPNRPLVNAGLTKAIAAAEQHKVGVIVPKFGEGSRGTDFNDMQVEQGIGAVTAAVDQAISQTMARSREDAAELARQRIGQDAAVGQPGANTRHTGEVVGVTAYHAAQVAGKTAVVHQVKDLDQKPTPGQTATIQYKDGKGKVTERNPEQERQAQLQR